MSLHELDRDVVSSDDTTVVVVLAIALAAVVAATVVVVDVGVVDVRDVVAVVGGAVVEPASQKPQLFWQLSLMNG